jgi:ATP synthase F0 subunit b
LEEDLARRDFTVNAMAYHPVRGLCDPYGGAEDLAAGIIRCVGEPGKEGEPVRRFSEDALRIVRALRFAAVRGMQIEPETKAAVFSEKDRLLNISAERIREELDKLLHGDHCADILIDYAAVIAVVIPEMRACIGFDQHTAYHKYNVWDHCAHAAENAKMSMATATALQEAAIEEVKAEARNSEANGNEAASAEAKNAGMLDAAVQMRWISSVRQGISCLKWAAMLHDIEKPACFFQTDDGNGHFYGHSEKSAETADRILERLKFDNARREKILMLIANHDRQFVLDVKPVKRAIRKFGKQDLLLLMDLYSADVSAQSELAFDRLRGHDIMRAAVMQLSKEPEAAFSRKDLAVNGRDMMALGYEGEAIGDILESLLDAVIEESLPNEREALLAFAEQKEGVAVIIPDMLETVPMLIAFIVLVIILWKFGWPKFEGMLEKREKTIAEALQKSEEARIESERVLAEYQQQLSEAKAQAAKIVADAKETGEAARADITKKAQEESAAMIEKARVAIEAEKQTAMTDLRNSVADLSVDVASRLIANDLDDDEHRQIIERYLNEAGSFHAN